MQFSLTAPAADFSSLVLPTSAGDTAVGGLAAALNGVSGQPFADLLAEQTPVAATVLAPVAGNPLFAATPSLAEADSPSAPRAALPDAFVAGATLPTAGQSLPVRAGSPLGAPVTNAIETVAEQPVSEGEPSPADAPVERPPAFAAPRPTSRVTRSPTRAEQEQVAGLLLLQPAPVTPVQDFSVGLTREITPAPLASAGEQADDASAARPEPKSTAGQSAVTLGANVAVKYFSRPGLSSALDRAAPAAITPTDTATFSPLLRDLTPAPTMTPAPVSLAVVVDLSPAGKQAQLVHAAAPLPSNPTPSSPGASAVPEEQVEAATVAVASQLAPGVEGVRPASRAARENFSAPAAESPMLESVGNRGVGLKKILSPDKQTDRENEIDVGIGVAEASAKMRHESPLPFASALNVEEIAVAPSAVSGLREAIAALAPEAAPVAAPRVQAVVTHVVDAARKLEAGAIKGMDLRFDFGANERLSVHVELRDGAVHTTFRTDSQLLRESIGTAWREVAPAHTVSEGRTVRLVEPVIARDTAAGLSAQADGGHTRQQTPQQAAEFAESTFALAAGRTRAARRLAALVEPIRESQALRPETALHLHAVA